MIDRLRSFFMPTVATQVNFAPAAIPDARTYRRILWAAALIIGVFVALSVLLGGDQLRTLSAGIAVAATLGIIGVLYRYGYTGVLRIATPSLFWLLITYAVVRSGGIFSLTFGAYVLLVLFAGFSVGAQAGYFFAGLSAVVATSMYWLSQQGLLPVAPPSAEHALSVQLILMLGAAAVIYINVRAVEEVAQQSEARQEALNEARRRYDALFRHSNDGVFIMTLDGHFAAVNQRGAEMLGYEVGELLGKHFSINVPSDQLDDASGRIDAALSGEDVLIYERVFVKADGTRFPVEINLTVVRDELGEPQNFQTVIRDITQRRQDREKLEDLLVQVEHAREKLLLLSRKLVDVQESERRFLARELHDEVGQTLTGLKLILNSVYAEAEPERQKKERALALVNELISRIRELSLDLRPPLLDDFGLVPAVQWMIEKYERQTGIMVYFQYDMLQPDRRYSFEVETGVFRVIQEALNNVARHARVNLVRVILVEDQDGISAEVSDTGAGFDLDATLVDIARSNGILGMKERLSLIGGSLMIESAPGAGTSVKVRVSGEGSG